MNQRKQTDGPASQETKRKEAKEVDEEWAIKYFGWNRDLLFVEKFCGTYDEARVHEANRIYGDNTNKIWGGIVEFWGW